MCNQLEIHDPKTATIDSSRGSLNINAATGTCNQDDNDLEQISISQLNEPMMNNEAETNDAPYFCHEEIIQPSIDPPLGRVSSSSPKYYERIELNESVENVPKLVQIEMMSDYPHYLPNKENIQLGIDSTPNHTVATTYYNERSDGTTEVNPKLVHWSIGEIRDNEDKNTVHTIESPTENSLSLCSLSPNIVFNTVEARPEDRGSVAVPSALCLSPIQRTPMQARKWRTMAAQAEAKKKVHKIKSASKSKKSIVRLKGYVDV
jgi:hypothetical protein